MRLSKRLIFWPALFVAVIVRADDQTPWAAVHGWLDGYYAANSNHPDPALNFFAGVGSAAHRADQLSLNVAAIEIVRDPKPLGFHVILGAGDALDVVHSAEPHGNDHPLRNLYQASASYTLPIGRGLPIEAGVYPSHIGLEGFFTKDNWNYTRGWLGEFSPYYQSGIKASYAWNDRWSAQLHVLRGWQNIGADVPAASGVQIAYSGAPLSGSVNTYADPHRKFVDFVATYSVTAKLSVGTSIDRGRQTRAEWMGLAMYGRYAFDERRAIAVRAERYGDPDGLMSGTPQTLGGATITLEYRPSRHLILKVEGRRDRSSVAVFAGKITQGLAIASAVAVF